MKFASLCTLWLAVTAVSSAQVQEGDLLLTTLPGLAHYRPNGTLVQAYSPGGQRWNASAVLPDGKLVVARSQPADGMVIFDPATSVIELDMDFDPAHVGIVGGTADVAARRDGTIVLNAGGQIVRYGRDGSYLGGWSAGLTSLGNLYAGAITVLDDDDVLIAFGSAQEGALQRRTAFGTLVFEVLTSFSIWGLDVAPNGTIWTVESDGFVLSYDLNGQGIFGGGWYACPCNGARVAAMPDGTLWFAGWGLAELRQYLPGGGPLSSFPTLSPYPFDLETPTAVSIGAEYCTATPNSSGDAARIIATGSAAAAAGDLHLLAERLPGDEFGYFLNSSTQGFVPNPGGSAGNLCVVGAIGRHVGQLASSGPNRSLHIEVDLGNLPRPNGAHAVMAGETWCFQCWFRDGATSNFTNGVCVTFQ